MRIKIRKADSLFSLYIRKRAKWKCEVCFKQFPEGDQYLQCSHFYGRRNEAVRFDPSNASAMCFTCHRKFTENPEQHREWKLRQLGQAEFDLLRIKASEYKKKDDYFTILALQELLKSIE